MLFQYHHQGVEDTKRKVKELHGCVVSAAEVIVNIIVICVLLFFGRHAHTHVCEGENTPVRSS